MKRSSSKFQNPITNITKKLKQSLELPPPSQSPSPAPYLALETEHTEAEVLNDENLLYEILKHVDERTLGIVCCVSKQWNRTAQDERLWELICTKHWTNMTCSNNQLRSVVLALGGFRRLHSHYLYPLSKSSISTTTSSSSSTVAAAVSRSAWQCVPRPLTVGCEKSSCLKTHYGQDELHLSLCLLSIRYFETISFRNRNN